MDIKKIILNDKIKFSFAFINNTRFLIIKNTWGSSYIFIPSNIKIKIESNLLNIELQNKETDKKNISLFNKFLFLISFYSKNLETIFKKKLVLKGLGFRMNVVENFEKIEFKLGFSHLIYITIPKTIKVKIKKNKINVEGTNKVLVGTFINKILSLKIPDCYKGKGFWYKYQKEVLKDIKKK